MIACIDVTLPPAAPRALPLVLVAAAALIDSGGRLLLASRPAGRKFAGLWEFPGGKIAAGESPEQALVRELREELGVVTNTGCLSPLGFASHAYDDFHLLMPLFACRVWQGNAQPREGQQLAWVMPRDLGGYALLPADLPLVPLLQAL